MPSDSDISIAQLVTAEGDSALGADARKGNSGTAAEAGGPDTPYCKASHGTDRMTLLEICAALATLTSYSSTLYVAVPL